MATSRLARTIARLQTRFDVRKSDFHFALPDGLIAQQPLDERVASRLLVLDRTSGRVADRRFGDLVEYLQAGDLLIFNDTRVIKARLLARKETGGRTEILIERLLDGHRALAQLRTSKSPRPGTALAVGDQRIEVIGREGEFFLLRTAGAWEELLERHGLVPLPPYIRRADRAVDEERYQTVYAREPGAVAAPTAGLHFDAPLLDDLKAKGVGLDFVTLHVGAGTFQPMRVERVEDHRMHRERYTIPDSLVRAHAATRTAGRRVVAVGTTVVRALESAWTGESLQAGAGETGIFIYPGREVRSIDALITNFHLPESTLLMLVCAFAGTDRTLAAYRHAVENRYRFFSYGDAMLVL